MVNNTRSLLDSWRFGWERQTVERWELASKKPIYVEFIQRLSINGVTIFYDIIVCILPLGFSRDLCSARNCFSTLESLDFLFRFLFFGFWYMVFKCSVCSLQQIAIARMSANENAMLKKKPEI